MRACRTQLKKLSYQLDGASPEEIAHAETIALDVSDPAYFGFNEQQLIEIIDHHFGFEDYWQERNVKTQIEAVGSVCTIIYERIIKSGHEEILTKDLCKMLIAGILDNTVNFGVTDILDLTRDLKAYREMQKIAGLDQTWDNEYFSACYYDIAQRFEQIVTSDIKYVENDYGMPRTLGQIIIPSEKDLVSLSRIQQIFFKDEAWILNVICLAEKRSIIYGSDSALKGLSQIYGTQNDGEKIILGKIVLRKTIIKRFQEAAQQH